MIRHFHLQLEQARCRRKRDHSGLEDHFVVVSWDQPGSGKSYDAVPFSDLSLQRYVSGAQELTQLLRARFHHDKIYVLGESSGTLFGLMLVQQYPELFHAYASEGQMVNWDQNQRLEYELELKLAGEQGNTALAEKLHRNGPPPYQGWDWFLRYGDYAVPLWGYMYAQAGEPDQLQMIVDMLSAPEYGLLDKFNAVRSHGDMLSLLDVEMKRPNFEQEFTRVQVPVYFLEGRWDVETMSTLAERYFDKLQAPHKELIWFDKSGHTPSWYEPDAVVNVLVNRVVAETRP